MRTLLSLLLVLLSSSAFGAITQEVFFKVIHKVERVYPEIIFKPLWSDPTENAYARNRNGRPHVDLPGGYARMKYMSEDAYLSVVCHEVGHHYGGSPRNQVFTIEGQADYFSSLQCMKKILRMEKGNQELAKKLDLPQKVKAECRQQFPHDEDWAICLRIARAALDFGTALRFKHTGKTTGLSLLTPDRSRASYMITAHSSHQCRVDTLYQGALCNADPDIPLSNENDAIGTCHKDNGHTLGLRPSCWYNPARF